MKALKMLSFLVILLVSLTAVFALDATVVKFGDEGQERGVTLSKVVTITNNDDNDKIVTEIKLDSNSDFDLVLIDNPVESDTVTLAKGESLDFTIEAFILWDLDAVDNDGKEKVHTAGSYKVSYNETNEEKSVSTNVLMQAENMLSFKTGEIIIEGTDKSLKDDKTYDAERGDTVEMIFEVENEFNDNFDCNEDNDECDIEDIDVEINSKDDELDWDETVSFNDLNPEDDDSETETFSIDKDIDESDYDVEIIVTGEDINGALHGDYWQIEIEISVPNDEVQIERMQLSPSILDCDETRTTLEVTIENTGEDDQDKASILLDSSRLDLKDSVYNIDIEEGDSETRSFDISIPESLEPGRYYISVIANVDNNEETHRDSATLTIRECVTQPPTDNNNNNNNNNNDDDDNGSNTDVNIIEVPPTAGVIVGTQTQIEEQNFFESPQYLMLLAVLLFIAVIMVLVLLIVLMKK